MAKKPTKDETGGFEDGLRQLEEIVSKMEEGSLTLEESIASFEEGMKLYGRCSAILENARNRVEKLVKEAGALATKPFEEEKDKDSGDDE